MTAQDREPAARTGRQADAVRVQVDDDVMTISLNRPERHNAVNSALHAGLEAALLRAKADPDIRVVLLRGEGRSFCSGGDVEGFADGEPRNGGQQVIEMASGRRLLETLLSVQQPIVAAVRGYALGLGATIALFCDVVVAAEDAQFADTHVNVGLVAGDGGAVAWPLLMSFGKAKYHLLTGERVSGAEADRMGLVFKAVPADELEDEALRVARKLASMAPIAVAGTKATLNLILRERMNLVLDYGLFYEGATFLTEDHREASTAFVEKRPPTFRNR
ncbi:enoyl-CoA hydratase/isomerase family protein [Kribbella solani]|uniref:enoyl-CoA hydratase/isomerase family protein n=1 Tax=Kribbella solani TaxID=236067 RepID=UPI0029AE3774|nr:enoyl-CoA hydratase-related protein [Kribbella solani]MDX2972668.1 enoyl-CoA hydratase-related protein [Kribbella solani]